MTSLYFLRFIKTLMVTTPFLTMILMVLALWGVGGKTIYTDQNAMNPQIELSAGKAKNILVKEAKSQELPSELENPKITIEESPPIKAKPLPEKIDWGLVV